MVRERTERTGADGAGPAAGRQAEARAARAARYLDLWEAQLSWLAAEGPPPAPDRRGTGPA